MKMVHENGAKQARKTHWYTFSTRNFTSFNFVNFPEHSKLHRWLQEIICSDARGGVTHKSWYLRRTESIPFSQQ